MTWFKRKTNEGSNPSQSVKVDNADIAKAAKAVMRNAFLPFRKKVFPINTTITTTSNTGEVIESPGALDRLRKYLEENGVEWHRCFDRDAIIFTMPSGDEVVVDGFIFIQAGNNEQLIVDYIMNQLDQFEE